MEFRSVRSGGKKRISYFTHLFLKLSIFSPRKCQCARWPQPSASPRAAYGTETSVSRPRGSRSEGGSLQRWGRAYLPSACAWLPVLGARGLCEADPRAPSPLAFSPCRHVNVPVL